MDYFRPAAIHYQKYGCYTKLRPNANPNSEFGKWIREETKRCYFGYTRESDGECVKYGFSDNIITSGKFSFELTKRFFE